jgi:hypothetical protein
MSGVGFTESAKYVIFATHLTQIKAEVNSVYSRLPLRCTAIRKYGSKYAKTKGEHTLEILEVNV